jgi:hypothetical protein
MISSLYPTRTMTPMSAEEIERLAHKRAGAKLGWYVHAAVYVVVNLGILAAIFFGWRSRPWNPYATMGWGLGLALHGVSVFVLGKGSGLRERMVAQERERLRREHGGS